MSKIVGSWSNLRSKRIKLLYVKSSRFQGPCVHISRRCVQSFKEYLLRDAIGLPTKIILIPLKFTITLESEDEKRHFHSDRLLLFLMKKMKTALSDLTINVLRLCT